MQRERDERLAELSAELWAMEPARLHGFLATLEAGLRAGLDARIGGGRGARPPYVLDEQGVATITMSGVLMGRVPSWAWWLGDVVDMGATRAAVEAAAADPAVQTIRLAIDSPGGTVSGTPELAAAVNAATATKRVETRASGQLASAAYWVGAQASHVSATPSTDVGSIGVLHVLTDWSQAYANEGLKVHVVSSHELKGIGVRGAPITEAQLSDVQSRVDRATGMFVDAVARGRRSSPDAMRQHATGQTWFAEDALARGLIDSIDRGTSAVSSPAAQAAQTAPTGATESEVAMSDKTNPAAQAGQKTAEELLAEERAARAKAEADLAKANAKAEAQAVALAEVKASTMRATIDRFASGPEARVTPALRPSVEKFAAACDNAAELEAFIKNLPVQTRAEQVGNGGPANQDDAAQAAPTGARPAAVAGAPGSGTHPDDIKVAKIFGIKPEDMAKYPSGTGYDPATKALFDGDRDGKFHPRV